jgi:hypothetical protein
MENRVHADEFRFCTIDDYGAVGNIKVLGAHSKEAAREVAESKFCNRNCVSVICAGMDFDQQQCGNSPQTTIELGRAQSQMFCEYKDGSSVNRGDLIAKLKFAIVPEITRPEARIASVVRRTNTLLSKSQCPLIIEAAEISAMLPAFSKFRIGDENALKLIAQYPGDFKFVGNLEFCGNAPSTHTVNAEGRERVVECTLPKFFTSIVAEEDDALAAVLILRGLAHMAGVEESNEPKLAYTLADPDLLIPASPLLEGKVERLRITKPQCVQIARYSRRLREMGAIAPR